MSEQGFAPDERAELDLALVESGPVHRALAAVGLRGRAVVALRASLFVGLASWVPLLIASLAEGHAIEQPGAFLHDAGVHVRALVALPLLLLAELIVVGRLRAGLRYLDDAGLVPLDSRARARAIVAHVRELQGSTVTHVLLVLSVVALSIPLSVAAPPVPTWAYPEASARAGGALSVAGWIDVAWSAALYRLVLVRWLFRLGLWSLFLAHLARLPLRTVAIHQDRVGGLAPLIDAHQSFGWVILGFSSTLAARLAVQVHLTGGDPSGYGHAIGAFCLLVPLLFLAPTFVFVWPLEVERRRILHELSVAATDFSRRFTADYVLPPARRAMEPDDVSAACDLEVSFDRVYGVWITPFRREHYVTLLAAAAAPMLAFFLATLPLEQVIERLSALLG